MTAPLSTAQAERSQVQRAVIDGWLPRNHANEQGTHWAVKQRAVKAEKQLAWWTAREACWQPVQGKARLTITLVFPSARYLPDEDNAVARCKHVIDGLPGPGGYFVDDSPEHLELVVTARVERGRKAVIMELSACADSDNEGTPE